jgi:hypothetical protein
MRSGRRGGGGGGVDLGEVADGVLLAGGDQEKDGNEDGCEEKFHEKDEG